MIMQRKGNRVAPVRIGTTLAAAVEFHIASLALHSEYGKPSFSEYVRLALYEKLHNAARGGNRELANMLSGLDRRSLAGRQDQT
jgi:hypothetical protein